MVAIGTHNQHQPQPQDDDHYDETVAAVVLANHHHLPSNDPQIDKRALYREKLRLPLTLGKIAHPRRPYNSSPVDNSAPSSGRRTFCEYCMLALSILSFVVTCPFAIFFTLKCVQEYERAVIFRLGRVLEGGGVGPGVFFVWPCVENYRCVDMRTKTMPITPQEILTGDSMTVKVDGVIYYRIVEPCHALTRIQNFNQSTVLLASTTIRKVLGKLQLQDILLDRDLISHHLGEMLDEETEHWGVKIERFELRDIGIPVEMQRAMATEAEAHSESRAKVIAAQGEKKASQTLKEAADVIASAPSALQLRYLQTIKSISREDNMTLVFPIPVQFLHVLPN